MLDISKANSIDFTRVNDNDPSPFNRPSYSERYAAFTNRGGYCQRFKTTDTLTVQLVSDTAGVPTVEVSDNTTITPSLITSYTSASDPADYRYFFEFDVVIASYSGRFNITVTKDDVFLSEWIIGEDLDQDIEDGFIQKHFWSNEAAPVDYFNFGIDYSTGIEFWVYEDTVTREMDMSVDSTIHTNITRKTLLENSIYEVRILKTAAIPTFMIRKLTIAAGHFKYMVNGVRFTALDELDIEYAGSNFGVLTLPLTMSAITAFNTDNKDTGDMEIIIPRQTENLTTTWTFVQTAGYILHVICVDHHSTSAAATATFKVGYTDGGDDIIAAFITNIVKTEPARPFSLHEQKSFDVDTTIYVEVVSGAGAILRVHANLLLNT